uniref:Uncharacterized protein n=1 Tax=Arundo donax TaxID=35708 RepID=A0A0A8ZRA5_ARUDO
MNFMVTKAWFYNCEKFFYRCRTY